MARERLCCVEAETIDKEALGIGYEVDTTRDIGMESLECVGEAMEANG